MHASELPIEEIEDLFSEGTLTLAGVEEEFGLKKGVLYDMMNAGELPWAAPRGQRLIPRKAIKKLILASLFSNGKGAVGMKSS